MNELIITSPEKLKQLISECFNESRQNAPKSLTKSEPKYLYSLKELAESLGCSVLTAFKLKNSGKIRFTQYGRKLIFNLDFVLEDLQKCGGLRKRKG